MASPRKTKGHPKKLASCFYQPVLKIKPLIEAVRFVTMGRMQDFIQQPGSTWENIPYDSPRDLSQFLKDKGLAMSKRFGQNFMISPHARQEIVDLLEIGLQKSIWEVGPGIGALTHHLIGKVKELTVFEIDFGFIKILKEYFSAEKDFSLIEGDIMKTWEKLWDEKPADLVCGNLPYNVASAFIVDCLEKNKLASKMVFTVQKEVGERMIAGPGDDNYSSFSVQCRARSVIKIESLLAPGAFYPAPEVQSAVVSLIPKYEVLQTVVAEVWPIFNQLVRSSFASRRKTLENNVKASALARSLDVNLIRDAAADIKLDLKRRAETLSPEEFLSWSAEIKKKAGTSLPA